LIYFVHRQDPVGILGYVVNVVPYSRNLMLVYRKRRMMAEQELARGFEPIVKTDSASTTPQRHH
jgi:hypothetical protein